MSETKNSILRDYSTVYNKQFKSFKGINDYIKRSGKSVNDIRNDFLSHKTAEGFPDPISFLENYHAVKFNGTIQINECIVEFDRILNDSQL